ncbi:hypothetical protein GDO78_013706 [Eleutherodactylus coqui]|uniref:Uncharacterized protein n=1 Tax=Eleutherodactylus coqui TaxID=57060 RepID=A0A8J6B3S9_ELECQ|nr:hypothetical protein GDO78_013706 [Eleutherodactylus coqui]
MEDLIASKPTGRERYYRIWRAWVEFQQTVTKRTRLPGLSALGVPYILQSCVLLHQERSRESDAQHLQEKMIPTAVCIVLTFSFSQFHCLFYSYSHVHL